MTMCLLLSLHVVIIDMPGEKVPTHKKLGVTRDLILGDDALLYIADMMLIWAPLILATRWSCS